MGLSFFSIDEEERHDKAIETIESMIVLSWSLSHDERLESYSIYLY
jgi:hypothetical protein